MTEPVADVGKNEEQWRAFLSGHNSREARFRKMLKLLPSDPRCELCAGPFAGPAAPVMRALGKSRSERNPKWCNSCFGYIREHRGGAEITASMLFADIRGSTSIAEKMSAGAYKELLDRFYDVASQQVFDQDGLVDKFVGDELVAQFFPLMSGERHVARALAAAQALLRATGHADPNGPWVPVGAGIHVGEVWIGTVGTGERIELTMVGDPVNTTARLAAAARAGEIV
jgi:adenylate cyclase